MIRDFNRLADVFATAHAETGNIADSLRAVFEVDRGQRNRPVGVMAVESETALKYGLRRDQMLSSARLSLHVRARQECWWRMRYELEMGYKAIARLHHKDHATIIWGVRRHEARLISSGETESEPANVPAGDRSAA